MGMSFVLGAYILVWCECHEIKSSGVNVMK